MYAPIHPQTIYQGDILIDYNFIFPPLGKPISVQIKGNKQEIIPLENVKDSYSAEGRERLIVNSFLADAMIVTQTCDIQRRDYISVAPVFKLNKLVEDLTKKNLGEKRIIDSIDSLKQQKTFYYLYLPPSAINGTSFEERYVDLQIINSMPAANIANYKRQVSLSDKGRHHLSFKLLNLFGRPF